MTSIHANLEDVPTTVGDRSIPMERFTFGPPNPCIEQCDQPTLTDIKNLVQEVKHLSRYVPGLILRGSIPEALHLPSLRRIPRDVDLLIIKQVTADLRSILRLLFDSIMVHKHQYPILFNHRKKIAVDLRTPDELAFGVSWYEWHLCRLDASTVGIQLPVDRTDSVPSLNDVLDYMEYLTYLGARAYTQPSIHRRKHESAMSRKIALFFKTISHHPPGNFSIPTARNNDPLVWFGYIIRILLEQAYNSSTLAQRVALLRHWFVFWRSRRHARAPLATSAKPMIRQNLDSWRINGKPWVSRDMTTRVVWSELLTTRDMRLVTNTIPLHWTPPGRCV